MKLVNLTPHSVNLIAEDGTSYEVKPSGKLARVTARIVSIGTIEIEGGFTMPHTVTEFGVVEGLPAPEDGVLYIVSSLVAGRVPDRKDVVIPNESVRDEKGRIIGCKSLGSI